MDETGVDLGPLARSPDFVAAFACRDTTLAPIGHIDDRTGSVTIRAKAVHSAWRVAQRLPGVRTAIWRGAGRTNLASDHGPVLVEGTAKLNLGVARVALRDLAAMSGTSDWPDDPIVFHDPVRRAIWALLELADRAELSRVMMLRAGDAELTLHVHRGAIRPFEADIDAATLLKYVRQANGAIEYSFARHEENPARIPITAADLMGGTPNGTWRFDSDGWPLGCPAGTTFATFASAIGLVRACRPIWGSGSEGDCLLLDAAGARLVHIRMTDDGLAGLGSGSFPTETSH